MGEKTYLSVFDKTSGERKTSYTIIGNLHGKTMDELKQKAADRFPDCFYAEQTKAEYSTAISRDLLYNGTGYEAPPAQPEPTLDELKSVKIAEVNSWTEKKITGGFTSEATGSPVRFDSDEETQLTLQGIALNASVAPMSEEYSSGIPVRGYAEGSDEKQVFYLAAPELMRLLADLSIHIMTCKQAGWEKQEEVQAAQTREELDSIVLE